MQFLSLELDLQPATIIGNQNHALLETQFCQICWFQKPLLQILVLDELYHQKNLQILKDLLAAFHSTEVPLSFFSRHQQIPMEGELDYMYYDVYSFLEGILETSFLLSFSLASEVVVTLHSLVNPKITVSCKFQETMSHVGCSQTALNTLRSRLSLAAHRLLVHDWNSMDTEWKSNGDIIQKILQIYLTNTESSSDLLNELSCSILPQVPSRKIKNTQDATHGFPTLCPAMFLVWYRVLHEENINVLSKLVKEVRLKHGASSQREVAGKMLVKIQQSVQVVVSLVSLCKVHDKAAVHSMAVKYGGKYVDLFLKAFDFLQAQFQSHNDLIIQMFKEIQKATRVIQALCSEAKGSKRTMVTSKIPSTKRSMEKFLFHVKALLHSNTSSGHTFWMGNLKHKDLSGQVVSSQVYSTRDETADQPDDLVGGNDKLSDESVGDCGQHDTQS